MSDQKISELNELTTPNATDVLAIVNSGQTKKIQYTNLGFYPLAGVFGGIHVHDNAAAQTIPTGATYTKITTFTDNDAASGVTPDAANDKVTIIRAGNYLLTCGISFTAANGNVTWFFTPFLDGVEYDSIHFTRKLGTAGDVGSSAMAGILTVAAVPVDIDIRARHTFGAGSDLTVSYANLSVVYVGE